VASGHLILEVVSALRDEEVPLRIPPGPDLEGSGTCPGSLKVASLQRASGGKERLSGKSCGQEEALAEDI